MCNDSLVKKLEELERTEEMYSGLVEHSRRVLMGYFDLVRVSKELGDAGVLADIAWSDPEDELEGWVESPRGAGYLFGQDALEKWNMSNGLELLVRGHQMVEDGFFWHHNRQTLTLFSAPNYMYRCGNTAAVLEIQPNVKNLHFKQFLADNNESTDIIPLPQFSQYFV